MTNNFAQTYTKKLNPINFFVFNTKTKPKMTDVLRIIMPTDCVNIIKEYTGEAFWHNGRFIRRRRIPLTDPRYEMLKKRPRIKQLNYDSIGDQKVGSVWFKLENNKFVVINVVFRGLHWNGEFYIRGDFWEMHYDGKKTVAYI